MSSPSLPLNMAILFRCEAYGPFRPLWRSNVRTKSAFARLFVTIISAQRWFNVLIISDCLWARLACYPASCAPSISVDFHLLSCRRAFPMIDYP